MRKSILALAIIMFFIHIGIAHSAAFEDAVEANKRGDYSEALRIFTSLAERGDAKSQLALAAMYAEGVGVMESPSAAIEWFYKAGMTYLENGQREMALTMYDEIQNVRYGHFLGEKLHKALYP